MFGWFKTPAARASCSKRFSRSGFCENEAGRTLIATSRPRRGSLARYTSPIPPAPRGETISYGPRRVPAERVIGELSRILSPRAALERQEGLVDRRVHGRGDPRRAAEAHDRAVPGLKLRR